MGMSIDEAKIQLSMKKFYMLGKGSEAVQVALDTMRKYQQIEQILKDIPYGGEATVRRIQEVVEDGKID